MVPPRVFFIFRIFTACPGDFAGSRLSFLIFDDAKLVFCFHLSNPTRHVNDFVIDSALFRVTLAKFQGLENWVDFIVWLTFQQMKSFSFTLSQAGDRVFFS